MSERAPHPAPAAPLRCAGCLYDLTGLPDDSVCPECAMPIAQSRLHGLNRNRAPVLAKALRAIIWAAAVRHGALLLAMLLLPVLMLTPSPLPLEWPFVIILAGLWFLMISFVVDWAALFILTVDIGVGGESSRRLDVHALRLSMLAQIVILLLGVALLAFMGIVMWGEQGVFNLTVIAFAIARFVQWAAEMFIFASLAQWLRRERLRDWLYAAFLLIPGAFVVGVLIYPPVGSLLGGATLIGTLIAVRRAIRQGVAGAA